MTESKIIFYDLASNRPECCWSLNTWKTRFTLNYKGIPYKTEWLELPEIEEKGKEMVFHRAVPGPTEVTCTLCQRFGIRNPDTANVLFDGIEVYDQVINGASNVPELRSLLLFLMHYAQRKVRWTIGKTT